MIESYPIVPVSKSRMTRSDKWKRPPRPCVAQYWAFRDMIRLVLKVDLQSGDGVVFVMPMPRSWTTFRKTRMLGTEHKQKPDISNLLKALEDACHADDSHLSHYRYLKKIWGIWGEIRIERDNVL